jgi:hypothetical protein
MRRKRERGTGALPEKFCKHTMSGSLRCDVIRLTAVPSNSDALTTGKVGKTVHVEFMIGEGVHVLVIV